MAGPRTRVRHKNRDSTYEVLGEAEAQISHSILSNGKGQLLREGDKMVVYRCLKTGKLWMRFPEEFNDGRFEEIN